MLLNSMYDKNELEYVELVLDSRNSVITDPRFSKLDWPTFFMDYPIQNIAMFKILEAEIPFSYYVVNSSNNTFLLNGGTVTLPVGNYTATTLATALQSALGGGYTVTYSSQTQKFTITGSAPFNLIFGSADDNGLTNPRLVLGMNPGVNSSSGNVLVAPNVGEVTGPNYLYVNSTSLGPLFPVYLPQYAPNGRGGGKGTQMAKLQMDVNPGEIQFHKETVPDYWFDLQNLLQLQSFDMYLTLGNNSTPLSLNGQSFSMKIGLFLYRGGQSKIQMWQK